MIEIDKETYIPKILDYAAVDDCGTVINPMIVEGQVHGATAHGIGAALMENCAYDENGNMLASHLQRLHADHRRQHAEREVRQHRDAVAAQLQRRQGHGRRRRRAAACHQRSAAGCIVCEGIIIDDSHNNASTLFELIQKKRRGELRQKVSVER